jgi:hypothetical protein
MYSEIIGTLITGGLFAGVWKLGRWSVRHKIVELEQVKEQLILSKDNHELLIEEIDKKIEDIQDYSKLSIFDKKTKIT